MKVRLGRLDWEETQVMVTVRKMQTKFEETRVVVTVRKMQTRFEVRFGHKASLPPSKHCRQSELVYEAETQTHITSDSNRST